MSTTMENPVYSEAARDALENDLANKRELIDERRHGLVIRVYWLRLVNEISMQLIDEQDSTAREFLIPNGSVLDARDHPEVYAGRAGMWAEPKNKLRED